jgi:SAM-dependent methyltransferase
MPGPELTPRTMDTIQTSYDLQALSETSMGMPSFYTAPHSIDCWRHVRMLSSVKPLVEAMPGARWMTVGDGRYGSDAAFLRSVGAEVVATSLTDERLREASALGHIGEYRRENAEKLSAEDGSFDMVFCKEAYHHFPRPPLALYEMLRVARTGVFMIEPMANARPLDTLKRVVKRMLRGETNLSYEPSGNYLYRLDLRELGQLMCAMGNHTLAFKGLNDFYHGPYGHAPAGRGWPFAVTRAGVAVQDGLCRLRLLGWGLCAVAVFNGTPPALARERLTRAGFTFIDLPRNPYVPNGGQP